MADQNHRELPEGDAKKERSPVEVAIVFAVAAYVVALIASNRTKVSLDFVLFSKRASLLVIIVLSVLLGFAGGYLAHRSRSKRD
jgi:ABC-type branched-subunit amino acid transport system permease subunit